MEHLEAIYDLIEGQWDIESLDKKFYLVCKDEAITEEVNKHQKYLAKPFWEYKSYLLFNGKDVLFSLKSDFEFRKKKFFQRKQGEKKRKAEKLLAKQVADRGIYGIYCDKELIYIGKTDVSFEERFKQHKINMEQNKDQYLYKYMRDNKDCYYELKPLINVKNIKTKEKITNKDIEMMELALITLFKPKCNIQGILQDYIFS